jgi:hypothetical protein
MTQIISPQSVCVTNNIVNINLMALNNFGSFSRRKKNIISIKREGIEIIRRNYK